MGRTEEAATQKHKEGAETLKYNHEHKLMRLRKTGLVVRRRVITRRSTVVVVSRRVVVKRRVVLVRRAVVRSTY